MKKVHMNIDFPKYFKVFKDDIGIKEKYQMKLVVVLGLRK